MQYFHIRITREGTIHPPQTYPKIQSKKIFLENKPETHDLDSFFCSFVCQYLILKGDYLGWLEIKKISRVEI